MSDNTSNKKVLEVRPEKGGLYSVAWQGGGELPEELRTLYTDGDRARDAIKLYWVKRNAPSRPVGRPKAA